MEPAPEGRTGGSRRAGTDSGTPGPGGIDERQLLLRQAEDTATEVRRRAEQDAARVLGDATAEASRRVDRAAEIADLLARKAACSAHAIVEAAGAREAEAQRRIEALDEAADAAAALAARTVAEAEEAAVRHRRRARDEAAALMRDASDSSDRMRRDLLSEAEAEVAAVLARARADAAVLRGPAELRQREAETVRDQALRERTDAHRHARRLAVDALHTVPEPVVRVGRTDTGRPTKRSALRRLLPFVLVLVAGLGLRAYVVEPFAIAGASMQPALDDGDRVIVNKLSYRFHAPDRGDVVVIAGGDTSNDEILAKRVIGLPGESVEVLGDGRVRVDGRVVEERYLPYRRSTVPFVSVEVAEDHVFVLGDNRAVSMDSRGFGSVPLDEIVGRVEVVIWPLTEVRGV